MTLRLLCSILLFFGLLSGCAANSAKQLQEAGSTPLSGQQIQTLVSGNSLHLESADVTARVIFDSDGKLQARATQDNRTEQGKWQVNQEDQLCLKFTLWYHGNTTCYSLYPEPGSNTLLFFQSNGALAFTAKTLDGQDHIFFMGDGAVAGAVTSRENLSATTEQATGYDERPSFTDATAREEAALTIKQMAKNCPDCSLPGVNLRASDLIRANLVKANLQGADLSGANLRRAQLSGANLRGAKLQGTNLPGADLRDADLTDADFSGANLLRADLSGARVDGIILDGANLEGVTGLTMP